MITYKFHDRQLVNKNQATHYHNNMTETT